MEHNNKEKRIKEWMKEDLNHISILCTAATLLFSISLYLLFNI